MLECLTLDSTTAPHSSSSHFYDDERGDPTLVLVVKATFEVQIGGHLVLAEQQPELEFAGECYGEDPQTSSYRFEPEVAPFKPSTDVVAIAHAWAPRAGTTCVDVGLQVGPVQKVARVFGDRLWYRTITEFEMTAPAPFERIPLNFERAFGGGDLSSSDPEKLAYEPRNPVGRGFHTLRVTETENDYAPNIEDPRCPIRGFWDRPEPVGFGFTSPHWIPRASFAGTYDQAWHETRKPLLPVDFDLRFFNGAPPGLIAPGYLRGDERVYAVGVRPEGPVSFNLPGLPPPRIQVALRGLPDPQLEPRLDTVILDFDQMRATQLWRCRTKLPTGPHDVAEIAVSSPEALTFPRAYTDRLVGRPAAN